MILDLSVPGVKGLLSWMTATDAGNKIKVVGCIVVVVGRTHLHHIVVRMAVVVDWGNGCGALAL